MKGRFAPSPTGRMHLGNIAAALASWLSVRSQDGQWLLRIEDLDAGRSRRGYAEAIEDDLRWLGLDWDEGGLDDKGAAGPYSQSSRGDIYSHYLELLNKTGYTYPCHCTRAEIMATQAPHQSDGRVVYAGTCRPVNLPCFGADFTSSAVRIAVPDADICFTDKLFGPQTFNLAREVGDFVVRRADGAWAYQFAVVVDDATMGVTEVVRGSDLLLSAAQQIYLYRLLGFSAPQFSHIPLLCTPEGKRLGKRDASLSMEAMRANSTPQQIIGQAAAALGLIDLPEPVSARELLDHFSWQNLRSTPQILLSTPGG